MKRSRKGIPKKPGRTERVGSGTTSETIGGESRKWKGEEKHFDRGLGFQTENTVRRSVGRGRELGIKNRQVKWNCKGTIWGRKPGKNRLRKEPKGNFGKIKQAKPGGRTEGVSHFPVSLHLTKT